MDARAVQISRFAIWKIIGEDADRTVLFVSSRVILVTYPYDLKHLSHSSGSYDGVDVYFMRFVLLNAQVKGRDHGAHIE